MWVWISKCHMCRHCQVIRGVAGWSSSAVGMAKQADFSIGYYKGKSEQQC